MTEQQGDRREEWSREDLSREDLERAVDDAEKRVLGERAGRSDDDSGEDPTEGDSGTGVDEEPAD